jgi:hypothetical protein
MKKLLFLLLICFSCEIANYEIECLQKERRMPVLVPNTETFGLADVLAAVEDHAGDIPNTLDDCFDNAVAEYYDPDYNKDSYAVANSMKRFRNYGKRTPEFVIIYHNSSVYYPASISNDGIIIDVASFNTIDPINPDYDSSNKVLIYPYTASKGHVITDYSDAYNIAQKIITRSVGTPAMVRVVNGNWISGFSDASSGLYRALASYASITTFNNNLFGGSPPTSGNVVRIIYSSPYYYYITSTGEVGVLSNVGSSTFDELHDSATRDWRALSYLNNIIIAYDSEELSRYATTADLYSWAAVNLNSTGSDFNVQKVLHYNSQYAVCLSGNTLYSVNHQDPPSMADITPTGYTIRDFIIDGSDIYAVGDYYGTNRIIKASSLSSGAWSTYIDNIEESIYRFWKY